MAIAHFRPFITPLDAEVDGVQQPVPWLYGSDAPVRLDLSNRLNSGEAVTNPVVAIRRLPTGVETAYTNEPTVGAWLDGAVSISGTIVVQGLHNLERDRIYRLEVLFGAANNRRGASLLVHCVE
jgi:hypothetical protein